MSNDPQYDLASRQLENIYANSVFGSAALFLFTVLLSTISWTHVPQESILTWVSINVFFIALHYIFCFRFKKAATHPLDIDKWKRIVFLSFTLRGIAFGSAGIVLFSHHSQQETSLTLVMVGMAGGAVSSYYMMRPVAIMFCITLIAPLAYSYYTYAAHHHAMLVLFCLLYITAMITISLKLYSNYAENIKLHLHTQSLLEDLQESQAFLDSVLKSTQESIMVIDADHRILMMNKDAKKLAAAASAHPNPQFCYELAEVNAHPCACQGQQCPVDKVLAEKEISTMLHTYREEDGKECFVEVVTTPIFSPDGSVSAVVNSSHDITKYIETSNQLHGMVQEKEMLIKEVHHRVKNNLATIQNLLKLQMPIVSDSASKHALEESQTRIRAMSMIHERLYRSNDFSSIEFSEYMTSLVMELFENYKTSDKDISLELDFPVMAIDVDTIIPCGLIINELIINALKYAFPKERQGEIFVGIEYDDIGTTFLVARDNGIGFPPGFDINNSDSMGMKIITSLARQIGAAPQVTTGDSGTEVKILLRKKDLQAFAWNDDYLTGIEKIDRQHLGLYTEIVNLREAIESGRQKEGITEIIPKLVAYTEGHFTTEEKYMDRYGFPLAESHKAEHRKFIAVVSSLVDDLKSNRKKISLKVYDFLASWLVNHIGDCDKKLGDFLATKGIAITKNFVPKRRTGRVSCPILVIEDEKLTQLAMTQFFDVNSYKYKIASNGGEALELADKYEFQLIVSDYMLPDMNGFEVIQQLREKDQNAPVIFLTGMSREDLPEYSQTLRVLEVLSKPVSYSDLRQKITRYFEENSPQTSVEEQPTRSIRRYDSKKSADHKGTVPATGALVRLPTLDSATAIARLEGDHQAYFKLLKGFIEDYSEFTEQIRKALASNDYKNAKLLAHNITGAAGYIGATELQTEAGLLDKKITSKRENLQVTQLTGFENCLAQTLKSISTLLAKNQADEPDLPPVEELQEETRLKLVTMFNNLVSFLVNSDFQAISCFNEIKECLASTVTKKELEQLEQNISRFNYEKALQSLKRLAGTLDISLPE